MQKKSSGLKLRPGVINAKSVDRGSRGRMELRGAKKGWDLGTFYARVRGERREQSNGKNREEKTDGWVHSGRRIKSEVS